MRPEATDYLDRLIADFGERFGPPGPSHLVRTPGRVNLIGDHIDYVGLSVLPVALQRHVAHAYRERPNRGVAIASTDARYPPRTFEIGPEIEPYADGDWGNYVKAAAQGLARRFGTLDGFDGLVHSDIPAAAGLSSSSALVVAAALAILHTNDIWIERMELAELLAEAEHYVGTRGGGMDQAICLAARHGSASRIDFGPLRLTAHPITPDWRFIVAFSLVRAEKSGVIRKTYNARTRECRKALERVADALDARDRVDSYPALISETSIDELLDVAEDALNPTLLKRIRHVLGEARRVQLAEKALIGHDLKSFGTLMSESHASLRDDFEVSCPELDELVDIAEGAGAAGARLTGAGMGGCVVALCDERRVKRVSRALTQHFYQTREYEGALADHLFAVEPADGASVTAL